MNRRTERSVAPNNDTDSMKAYYERNGITIYHGDCLETLPNVSDFDTVITDPPYASGARRDADKTTRGKMTRMEDADWFSHDQMTGFGRSQPALGVSGPWRLGTSTSAPR